MGKQPELANNRRFHMCNLPKICEDFLGSDAANPIAWAATPVESCALGKGKVSV